MGLESGSPADDLDKFGGDRGLSGAVEFEREFFDEFASVFGGRIHRAHPSAHLSGEGFTQRTEDLGVDVKWQQVAQEFIAAWLVEVVVCERFKISVFGVRDDRKELFVHRFLADDGLELVIDDHEAIVFVVEVILNQGARDLVGIFGVEGIECAAKIRTEFVGTSAEILLGFASSEDQFEAIELALVFGDVAFGGFDQVGVKTTTQAPISADHEKADALCGAGQQKGMGLVFDRGSKAADRLKKLEGVGPSLHEGLLGAAQLGCGHHLHGFGDLLGIFDGGDPFADFFEIGHDRLPALRGAKSRGDGSLHRFGGSPKSRLVGFEVMLFDEDAEIRSDGFFDLCGEFVSEFLFVADRGVDFGELIVDVLEQALLKLADFVDRKGIKEALAAGIDGDDLLFDREGSVLVLFEEFGQTVTTGKLGLGGFVEVGAELGEGFHGAVLGEIEAEGSCDLFHGADLGVSTDARDGDPDVDRGTDACVKQVGFEEDLTIGDGDDVGGDISGDVARLGFDDREGGEGATATCEAHLFPDFFVGSDLGGAFEQAAVEIEDVTGISFATGGTTKQEGHLTVADGVFGKVIINEESVASAIAEEFAHGDARVGGEELLWGGFRGGSDDDGGVIHRAIFFEDGFDAGDGGLFLTDSDIDAEDGLIGFVGAFLVDDGVDGDGSFAGLTVTDDQLALSATDGDHAIDGLEAGLKGFVDGFARDDPGGFEFDAAAEFSLEGAFAIDGDSEGVDDATDKGFTDRDFDDAACALDGIAFLDAVVAAQDHGTDVVFFQVEHHAHDTTGELKKFSSHGLAKAVDTGDPVTDGEDGTRFSDLHPLIVVFDLFAYNLADLFSAELHSHGFFSSMVANRSGDLRKQVILHICEAALDAAIVDTVSDAGDHTADQVGVGIEVQHNGAACLFGKDLFERLLCGFVECLGRSDVDVNDIVAGIQEFLILGADLGEEFCAFLFDQKEQELLGLGEKVEWFSKGGEDRDALCGGIHRVEEDVVQLGVLRELFCERMKLCGDLFGSLFSEGDLKERFGVAMGK